MFSAGSKKLCEHVQTPSNSRSELLRVCKVLVAEWRSDAEVARPISILRFRIPFHFISVPHVNRRRKVSRVAKSKRPVHAVEFSRRAHKRSMQTQQISKCGVLSQVGEGLVSDEAPGETSPTTYRGEAPAHIQIDQSEQMFAVHGHTASYPA